MSADPPDAPLLEIVGVSVSRGSEEVLSQVSFSVGRGTLHALAGPNGSGKTTLLSAILGQVPFTGRIVVHWAHRRHSAQVGYVPQFFHVDRSLPVTVADFLALTRQQRPVCFGIAANASRRISLLLDRVGLAGFERRPLSVLSGGELRLVLLANALDPIPELLMLDEPASGLDEHAAGWLDETLISLKRDVTVIMVTHDSDQVRRIADQVTLLERARA